MNARGKRRQRARVLAVRNRLLGNLRPERWLQLKPYRGIRIYDRHGWRDRSWGDAIGVVEFERRMWESTVTMPLTHALIQERGGIANS